MKGAAVAGPRFSVAAGARLEQLTGEASGRPSLFYGALQTRVCPLRRKETSSLDVAQRTEAGVGIRKDLRVYLALPCARCHHPYRGEGGR